MPGIVAGGNIIVTAADPSPSAAHINVRAVTDILADGHIDVLTNGWILVLEKHGDLRVGDIHSTADDVTLFSPRRIVDALSDFAADVTGRNITMTAGMNSLGEAEGIGGIGERGNFLEIDVDAAGGPLGVLNAFDFAAPVTDGVFLTETEGDMKIDSVTTNGDASLVTRRGSLVDARNAGAGDDLADILANTVDLKAVGGSIGSTSGGNDLEMNSGWQHTSTIAAEATDSIYLTETAQAANVVLLEAYGGDIRFTVRESALTGEDLNLLPNGSTLVDETTGAEPDHELLAQRAVRAHRGAERLDQPAGRATTSPRSTNSRDPRRRVDRHLRRLPARGRHEGHLRRLPGLRDDHRHRRSGRRHGDDTSAGEITPGLLTSRLSFITRIFGNFDDDQFLFVSTTLGGKTRTYGSNTPTDCPAAGPPGPCGVDAPYGNDGLDLFIVNLLPSMNVAAGHTLTLDGQADTDTYIVNTNGGEVAVAHDYVINVLDTGAKNDGLDTLTVNGTERRRRVPAPPGDQHRHRHELQPRVRRDAGLRRAPARLGRRRLPPRCATTSSGSTTTRTSTRG